MNDRRSTLRDGGAAVSPARSALACFLSPGLASVGWGRGGSLAVDAGGGGDRLMRWPEASYPPPRPQPPPLHWSEDMCLSDAREADGGSELLHAGWAL